MTSRGSLDAFQYDLQESSLGDLQVDYIGDFQEDFREDFWVVLLNDF